MLIFRQVLVDLFFFLRLSTAESRSEEAELDFEVLLKGLVEKRAGLCFIYSFPAVFVCWLNLRGFFLIRCL